MTLTAGLRPCAAACSLAAPAALALALAATLATGAQAQTTAPATPPALAPGSIERQFQAPPEPRSVLQPIQLPGVQQRPPTGADTVRFSVKRITVDGASALSADTVRALVSPLEGREVSLSDLITVANRLTATYRNEGYILAQVVVPEQRIEPQDAVVRLQAIEGFVDAVRFSGDQGGHDARLAKLADAIRAARPLTASTLERYLLLLNDMPGLRASTTLTPAPAQPGAADLEIRLSRSAVAGEVSIDNRGSRAVGPWRATVDVDVLGLTGASRTGAKLVTTGDRELAFGHLRHEQTVNSEGTRIVLTASAAQSRPDVPAPFSGLALETRSSTVGLAVHHPVIRSRAVNLYARVGFTGYDGETIANDTRTGQDRVRALRLGMTWDRADAWQGLNIVDVEVSKGITGVGAASPEDPLKSRAGGRPDFLKATLYAARLQSVARRWSILGAASAQYARTDLLAPELFGVGGETFGRGFEPNELLGDHGASVKFELRYSGSTSWSWLPGYTLYGFYDAGLVRRRSPVNEDRQATLASTGLGLRFGSDRGISGFIELARPLNLSNAALGDRDPRSHAGIAAKF